jgi:hypothetical protein
MGWSTAVRLLAGTRILFVKASRPAVKPTVSYPFRTVKLSVCEADNSTSGAEVKNAWILHSSIRLHSVVLC